MKLFAAILFAGTLIASQADVATSANYGLTIIGTGAGGGRSSSETYTSDITLGLVSGRSSATFFYATALGYAAQLNNPPIANDDLRSNPYDTLLDLFMPTLLPNDSDPDLDAITLKQFDTITEEGGSVVSVPPYLRYSPPAGLRGADEFNYTIIDIHGDTDTATVTLIAVPPTPAKPNGLTMIPLADGTYLVHFQGPTTGRDYIVLTKADLSEAEWQTYLVAHVGGDGVVDFIVDPRTETRRFFQVLVL
jgi:hypothetical protein